MKDFLFKLFAKRLDGKKSYIGAAGKALTGVSSIITGVLGLIGTAYPDLGFPEIGVEASWAFITGGWFAAFSSFQGIGAAHKTEKLKAAVNGKK